MDYRKHYTGDESFKELLPKNMKQPIVSGHEYKKLCKWNLCSRYKINFDDELIEQDDLVFSMGGKDVIRENIERFFLNEPKHKFRLIIGNTDESFDDEDASLLEPYTTKIWAVNNISTSPNVISIPLGFNDNSAGWVDRLDWEYYNTHGVWEKQKHRLCLVKFWRNSLRPGRSEAYNHFLFNTHFTDCRNENDWLPVPNHYEEVKMYKYQVCPTGNGLDTHRFWECILFDTIPIIKKSPLSPFLTQFPCLYVLDWEEITEDLLNDLYPSLYEELKTWKEENPNWLYSKNYIK